MRIKKSTTKPLRTPDGRYIVVRGRLWRAQNPHLAPEQARHWVDALMHARRAVRTHQGDAAAQKKPRASVHAAKVALGERGAVWWADGAPDFNRRLVANTPYAAWYNGLPTKEQATTKTDRGINAVKK